MRDEEDEPEQAVADQAGELPSIDLRYRIAEDESERMGVAGEGADVDRRAPQRREIEHPASRFVQKHGGRRQRHERPDDPPIALRRPLECPQRAGRRLPCLIHVPQPHPSQPVLSFQRNTKRPRAAIADATSCDPRGASPSAIQPTQSYHLAFPRNQQELLRWLTNLNKRC